MCYDVSGRLRILVIEDEAMIRLDLVHSLQELGFEVIEAIDQAREIGLGEFSKSPAEPIAKIADERRKADEDAIVRRRR